MGKADFGGGKRGKRPDIVGLKVRFADVGSFLSSSSLLTFIKRGTGREVLREE